MTTQRRFSEFAVCPSKDILSPSAEDNDELRLVDLESFKTITQASIGIVAEFCAAAFDQFTSLTNDSKVKFLRTFMTIFRHVECTILSARRFPDEPSKRSISITMYYEAQTQPPKYENYETAQAMETIHKLANAALAGVPNAMIKKLAVDVNIDDVEFAALLGLIFWFPKDYPLAETEHTVTKAAYSAIFDELDRYTRTRNNSSSRMAQIMMFLMKMQETLHGTTEILNLFRVFDAFDKDSALYSLLEG